MRTVRKAKAIPDLERISHRSQGVTCDVDVADIVVVVPCNKLEVVNTSHSTLYGQSYI
jgi:hypothetical protein